MAVPTDVSSAVDGAAPAPKARVFVGGLPAEATARDLRDRFARFVADGASSVGLELELVPSKAPWAESAAHRGVAFLTLTGEHAEDARVRLVKTFNRTKWRGSVLRVEPARPHYLERLRQEWQARSAPAAAAAATTALTAAAGGGKPLRLAVSFAGKRRTTFEDLEEGERLLEEAVMEQEDDDAGGSTSQDDGSDDEDDSDIGSESDGESEASGQEERSEHDAQEVVGEDDIEQFVRQMEAEAASLDVSATSNERAGAGGDDDDDEAARAKANARRVAALTARQQQRQLKEEQQRKLVAAAVSTGAKSKKITFDDDGEALEHNGDSDDELANPSSHGGHLVTDWLESDSEKEDDDEDERVKAMDPEDRELLSSRADRKTKSTLEFFTDKDAEEEGGDVDQEDSDVTKAFALRPEFLGESGKRLFEMQKRFGGDQRFRLDARFMEDDEFAAGNDTVGDDNDEAMADDVGEMQTFLDEDGRDDEAARELAWQAEQDTALATIEKLFPDLDVEKIKHRLRVQATKDPIKEASWMGRMKRYDPRDPNARREFEIVKEDTNGSHRRTSDDAEADDAARRKAERENKPVVVGGDRFFATSNSLGSMFTRVRKNSEDGMEGEAALDGVFGFGNKAAGDVSADASEADGGSTFKLSSLFAFPVEDEKKIASMGESLLEQDDEQEEAHKEPWHFTQGYQDAEEAPEGEEDVETDGEGDDAGADNDDAAKRKTRSKNKRSLADFLAFGRTFLRSESGDSDGKEWAKRRKRLTLDFKRKRRDALKSKKKQQQQFVKQKKPRRS